jgi:nitrogen fixation/metabolism regulation signal transduction histidine kinase
MRRFTRLTNGFSKKVETHEPVEPEGAAKASGQHRTAPRQRLNLGRGRKRLGYERRLRLILWVLSLPLFALATLLLYRVDANAVAWGGCFGFLLLAWAVLQAWVADELLRPLQTLSNVVAALREQDYSFRARGARRGDALGDLALEVNALANDLQAERLASLESAALVRRVLDVLEAPVLAFDGRGRLRLLNPAAARLLGTGAQAVLGLHAAALGMEHLLAAADEQVVTVGSGANAAQWVVRRSQFRQRGVPHDLLLLADVSAALRQEEKEAWRRLIRVLGHEINNSLTPIKSLAGSLRSRLRSESFQAAEGQAGEIASSSGRPAAAGFHLADFDRPLAVIEERADSLNRFLAAYRQLAQLAPPQREPFALGELLRQLASLETRVPVHVFDGAGGRIVLQADKDQLAQAVINLLRNGAEAALGNSDRAPALTLSWRVDGAAAVISIEDTGLGVANPSNLFVPFYTTKQDGTGIGLALVKQIAEGHGGSVVLLNRPGGGAEAQLRFPMEG